MGTPSATIPQNQRGALLPAGLSRSRSGIAVGHVTEMSWVRFQLETSFSPKKFFRYNKPPFVFIYLFIYLLAYNEYIYIYCYKEKYTRDYIFVPTSLFCDELILQGIY